MAYLEEVSNMIKAIAKASSNVNSAKDLLSGNKSIARGALDGTMQFPCLVSDAISIDMASTLARMLERVYASFAQSYLSMHSTIDISVDKNPSQFLKRFHKNIKMESVEEDAFFNPIDYYKENCVEEDVEYDQLMERIYDGSSVAYLNEKENEMILFNFSDSFNAAVFESNRQLLEESLKDIDFLPFPNVGNSPFYEADENLEDYAAKKAVDSSFTKANKRDEFGLGKDRKVPTLHDSDVKKSNDMQPYLMQVRLMAINDKNEFVQFMDFIVGIKVNLHVVKSDQMITVMQQALKNESKLFNFIRWTTGEKSLIKDLLLNIDEVKLDAANKSRGMNPWASTLKEIRNESKAQAAFMSKTKWVPEASVVISSFDADMIEKTYGLDIRNPQFATKLMDALFLMTFIIVDDATRTVQILYDKEKSFQTYALETLEREVSMNSNKIGRELTRMISR